MKGLRKSKYGGQPAAHALIHSRAAHSLRETVVRATPGESGRSRRCGVAESPEKVKGLAVRLCVRLFQEDGIAIGRPIDGQIRAFDLTTMKEPGKVRGAL